MKTIIIRVANLCFQIQFDNSSLFLADRLSATYTDWLTQDPPKFYITIRSIEKESFQRRFPHQGSASRPFIARLSDQQLKVVCLNAAVAVDLKNSTAEIFNINSNSDLVAEQIMAVLLRNLASYWLASHNIFLVHSCGVVTNHGVALFAGPSDSGKSTIACLADGRVVLNDETVAVQSVGEQLNSFGTPWRGTAEKWMNIKAKLGGVFFLCKAPQTRCVKLRPQEAYVLLIKNTFSPFGHESFLSMSVDLCIDIIQRVPCYLFYFVPKPTIWESVDLALAEELNVV